MVRVGRLTTSLGRGANLKTVPLGLGYKLVLRWWSWADYRAPCGFAVLVVLSVVLVGDLLAGVDDFVYQPHR